MKHMLLIFVTMNLLFLSLCGAILPGQGFNPFTGSVVGAVCFKAEEVSETCLVDKSEVSMEKLNTYTEFQDKRRENNSFKAGVGKIFNIQKTDIDSEDSQSQHYQLKYVYGNVLTKTKIFSLSDIGFDLFTNPKWVKLYKKQQEKNNDMFTRFCGSHFIEKITLHAELIINIFIKIDQIEKIHEFAKGLSAGAAGSYNGTKISIGFSRLVEQYTRSLNLTGTLKIHATQRGGNPARLASIFAKSRLSECSIQNIQGCETLLDNIQDYAAIAFVEQVDCGQDGNFQLTHYNQIQSFDAMEYIGIDDE